MPSIFTRIIQGEIPCYKIFENEHCLSFLSLDAIQPGHTLIVPKIEIDHFMDVSSPYYQAVFNAAQPIGRAILHATHCNRVGVAAQGFEVPHFHLHLIPLWSPADFSFAKAKRLSEEEMKEIQNKILQKMK